MINRYFRNGPEMTFDLATPPIQEFEQTLAIAQRRYDTNYDTLNTLKNRYMDSLKQDRAEANRIQAQYDTRINNMIQSVGGDYSKLNDQVRLLKSDMMKDYSPGGKAYAISTNKKIYDSEIARQKQRLAKGEVTQEQLHLLNNYVDNNYKGVGTIDPLTGSYNQLSMPELAQYVDPSNDIRDTFSKAPRRKIKRVTPQSDGKGHIIYTTQEEEVVDPSQLESSGYALLSGNRKYLNYLQNISQLSGHDPNQTKAFIGKSMSNLVQGLIPEYSGKFNDVQEIDIKTDDMAKLAMSHSYDLSLERVKQGNREKLERLKNDLKQVPDAPPADNVQLLTVANNATGRYLPVDPNKQELEVERQQPEIGRYGLYGPLTNNLGTVSTKVKQKVNIADILTTPDKFPSINTELLRSIERTNPNATPQQKWSIYNDALSKDDYGAGIYVNAYDTPEAMKRDADVNFPKLATGQADILYVDGKTGKVSEVPASRQKELFTNYWDKEKRTAKISVMGKTLSQTGNVPVGAAFSSPIEGETGYYIMPELEERMRNYNNTTRVKAFGFIQENKSQGEPFEVYNASTKSRHTLVGTKTYEQDPTTGSLIPKVRYAQVAAVRDGKVELAKREDGTPDYLQSINEYGEVYDLSPAHIELMVRPEIRYPVNKRTGSKDANILIED